MKNKTNLQKIEEKPRTRRAGRKEKRTGPLREKVQITVRIDQQLINSVYAQMKIDNARITDMIEEGLIETLKKRRQAMPQWTSQVRFMVANATNEQEKLVRGLLIAMVEDQIEGSDLSPEAIMLYETCKVFLLSRNELEHARDCIASYSRYGKTPEEIAKLRA